MKPMALNEYVAPVGNEFSVPSLSEAITIFASQNIFGRVKFGITHSDLGDCPSWLNIPIHGQESPLKATNDSNHAPVKSFTEVPIGTSFTWRNRYFTLVEDEYLQAVIREVIAFPSEEDISGYAEAKGWIFDEVFAIKVYKIGRQNEFLFPAWYLQAPEFVKKPHIIFPMFVNDVIAKHQCSHLEMSWTFMQPRSQNPGETEHTDEFIRDGEKWRLYEDPERGLYINKAYFSQMQIIKKEEG